MASTDDKAVIRLVEAREALERFVVDNDDLLALEARIGKFNIFDALGIAHAEIRHSNFLAFILDPAESHGQGQLLLKAFLMDLLKHAPAESRPLSPIDLDGIDLRGIEVSREWKNIDLLIHCKEPQFAVVIENKVGSREHSNQLGRYRKTVADHYDGVRTLFVYLTPDGSESSDESWVPYTYADIHRVFTRIRQTYHNAIGDDVRVFLDHYLHLLGTRFMNDEELDKLCRQIHKNHRLALDLIWERAGSPSSGGFGKVATAISGDDRCVVVMQRARELNFIPHSWQQWISPIGTEYDDDRVWLIIKVRIHNGVLESYLELQGIQDAEKRKQLVDLLLREVEKCGFRSHHIRSRIGARFTRVSGRETIVDWPDEDEPEEEAIHVAMQAYLTELHSRLEKLASALQPMCKQLAVN